MSAISLDSVSVEKGIVAPSGIRKSERLKPVPGKTRKPLGILESYYQKKREKTAAKAAAIVEPAILAKSEAPLTPKKSKIQALVDQNKTPEKTYDVKVDESGWVSLPLTPGAKKAANIIYMFRSKSTKRVLIGKTEGTAAKRVSGYVSTFNHPEKDKGKLPLPRAVQANPTDFEFGILCKSPLDVDLGALEQSYEELKGAITHGFNERKGGGGGHARKADKENITPEKVDEVRKALFQNFSSPVKKPIRKTETGYTVPLSPNSKKTKKVIYVFKNRVTGERYVGKTLRELRKRISEHMHYAKHPEKDTGKTALYEAIRKDHASIDVGILYSIPKEQEGMSDEIEKAFIAHYDSDNTGYNGNAGGGGG